MRRVRREPLNFDRGIEKIIRASGAERAAGADGVPGGVAPTALAPRSRLDLLYSQPSLDDYLHEALQPDMEEAALLLPVRFNAAVASARSALQQAMAATADSRVSRLLRRADRELADQESLRELLGAYRGALLKG